MVLLTHWRRLAIPNPIAPFTWEAEAWDGRLMRQFQDGRIVYTPSIERQTLALLRIYGHTAGPLELPVPFRWEVRPLDEVICKCSTDMHLPTPDNSQMTYTHRWFFGYRYGTDLYLLEIDEHGEVYRTNTDRGQGTGANDIIIKGGPLL